MMAEEAVPQTTDEQDNNVSPEEQEQYTRFEDNYLRLIYDGDQVRPELLEALQNETEAPPELEGQAPPPHILALANVAVQITGRIDDAAREAGEPITDDVLFHGGKAVIEELATVAEAANIRDYSEEEMAGALTLAVDMYREKAMADGRTDEETLNSEWERLIAADKAGNADSVVPGIMEAGQ